MSGPTDGDRRLGECGPEKLKLVKFEPRVARLDLETGEEIAENRDRKIAELAVTSAAPVDALDETDAMDRAADANESTGRGRTEAAIAEKDALVAKGKFAAGKPCGTTIVVDKLGGEPVAARLKAGYQVADSRPGSARVAKGPPAAPPLAAAEDPAREEKAREPRREPRHECQCNGRMPPPPPGGEPRAVGAAEEGGGGGGGDRRAESKFDGAEREVAPGPICRHISA